MDRIQQSHQKYQELFGDRTPSVQRTDPGFQDISNRFIFGDIFHRDGLPDQQRELLTLAVLTVNQTFPQLKAHVGAALNTGLSPVEIKEAVYQCAPYIGFPKVLCAISQINEALTSHGVSLPLEPQSTTNEEDRFEKGLEVQTQIFGDAIRQGREAAPKDQQHIQDYLSAMCFGDFYTRKGLDLQMRELLTLCVVSALGGCESQVRAHIRGNINVGNNRETMVNALTHCLPYVGFPRTLNALSCVNELLPEEA